MSIEVRLQDLFRMAFGDDAIEIHDELSASDRADWDSVANLNLMFLIEQEFGIEFKGSEFMNFRTVGDLRRRLQRSAA
jgi:acyl carrier protein